jgi:hypothetical protein
VLSKKTKTYIRPTAFLKTLPELDVKNGIYSLIRLCNLHEIKQWNHQVQCQNLENRGIYYSDFSKHASHSEIAPEEEISSSYFLQSNREFSEELLDHQDNDYSATIPKHL